MNFCIVFHEVVKPLGVTHLKSLEKYLHSSLHSFISLHLQKRSCYDTNFKAKKVYSLFDAQFSQLFTFSFFIASIHDFEILITCCSVVIMLTITMNIYSIITLRVRYSNIFWYFQELLIRLNLSMEFANCTESVKDGLHPSPGVKGSDSTLITFLLDSK